MFRFHEVISINKHLENQFQVLLNRRKLLLVEVHLYKDMQGSCHLVDVVKKVLHQSHVLGVEFVLGQLTNVKNFGSLMLLYTLFHWKYLFQYI